MTALLKKNKHFSFFHLNVSSLPFHFEELSILITEHNLNFDFLGISESRLELNQNPLNTILNTLQLNVTMEEPCFMLKKE